MRTVPVPGWVKSAMDVWAKCEPGVRSAVPSGRQDRQGSESRLHRSVIWSIDTKAAADRGSVRLRRMTFFEPSARLCHQAGGSWNKSSSF